MHPPTRLPKMISMKTRARPRFARKPQFHPAIPLRILLLARLHERREMEELDIFEELRSLGTLRHPPLSASITSASRPRTKLSMVYGFKIPAKEQAIINGSTWAQSVTLHKCDEADGTQTVLLAFGPPAVTFPDEADTTMQTMATPFDPATFQRIQDDHSASVQKTLEILKSLSVPTLQDTGWFTIRCND